MSTLYELFKVSETATPEEITDAYHKILKKADSLPQNENIIEQVRRIKIAYGILSDSEKRKRYDLDLATKRADELLKKIPEKEELIVKEDVENEPLQLDEAKIKQAISEQIDKMAEDYPTKPVQNDKIQKLIEREQKKQIKEEKRKIKKQQQLKREMEIQAYGKYLERQGYKVKYPWTWLRVKRFFIEMIVIIIIGLILWQIPFIRNAVINLYEENFVIKFIVDGICSIFK